MANKIAPAASAPNSEESPSASNNVAVPIANIRPNKAVILHDHLLRKVLELLDV